MPFPISLDQECYEALVALAREGTKDKNGQVVPERARILEQFLRRIEKENGINRYTVWVQWQEARQPLPPSTQFPETWPPQLRARIDLVTRPIARSDVETLLRERAIEPVNVLVTTDPGGIVGWRTLDDFFTL